MRFLIVVLWMLLATASAFAQVSIGVSVPGVSIGINVPTYPQLVRVPGYPVYYAPGMRSNFFFYDGMYWVYQNDNWYASTWYNGPWGLVGPDTVPLFVLRIPVRYYRNPPVYFGGWQTSGAPHWGEHWGRDWEQHRTGWDQWDHRAAPAPAPLPVYQRQYSGNRYPAAAQQPMLRAQNYRYEPKDTVAKQHFQEQAAHVAPAPVQRAQPQQAPVQRPSPQAAAPTPREQTPREQNPREQTPAQHAQQPAPAARPEAQAARPALARPQERAPAPAQPQQRAAVQEPARQPRQAAPQPERQAPNAAPREAAPREAPQGKAPARAPAQGKEPENDREKK